MAREVMERGLTQTERSLTACLRPLRNASADSVAVSGLARLKRWLVGGAVAVAGLFGAAVSQATPVDDAGSGSDNLRVG
jgi:hypothetical protein